MSRTSPSRQSAARTCGYCCGTSRPRPGAEGGGLSVARGGGELSPAEAKVSAQQALAGKPGLLEAYWSLVGISLQTKDHAETARLLALLEGEHGVALGDLSSQSEYAEFVRSDAGRKWQKERKTK